MISSNGYRSLRIRPKSLQCSPAPKIAQTSHMTISRLIRGSGHVELNRARRRPAQHLRDAFTGKPGMRERQFVRRLGVSSRDRIDEIIMLLEDLPDMGVIGSLGVVVVKAHRDV